MVSGMKFRNTSEKAKVVTARRGKSDRETELERRVAELEAENSKLKGKGVDASKTGRVTSAAKSKKGITRL